MWRCHLHQVQRTRSYSQTAEGGLLLCTYQIYSSSGVHIQVERYDKILIAVPSVYCYSGSHQRRVAL